MAAIIVTTTGVVGVVVAAEGVVQDVGHTQETMLRDVITASAVRWTTIR